VKGPIAKRILRFMLVGAVLAMASLLVACGPELAPPAQSVNDLLELRADRSQDASAYAEYVASPELAQELAAAAEEESTSPTPPTPAWEDPYVALETSSTARVVVVWKSDDRFEEWPVATVFITESVDGMWRTADAELIEDEADIPPELDEEPAEEPAEAPEE
jgi:hypothetical protein